MKRRKENYTPYIAASLGLTVTILIVFQVYLFREPSRIDEQEAADRKASILEGASLFEKNCTACHGEEGIGGIGPALNSRELLSSVPDGVLLDLTRSGIPGSVMPAWGQVFGGPMTDEELSDLVTYIRSWEATAPQRIEAEVVGPDPVRGAAIYERTCFICHGPNGQGTDQAPALNDPRRLTRLDDNWYRNTIAHGRPAKGMPTWGTVLSPAQINDLVALIALWREGETVNAETSLATLLNNALFAIREFDPEDAEFFLNASLDLADDTQADEIREIIQLIQDNSLFEAESRVATLLPPEEMGEALYVSSCASCHGVEGMGGLGPNLRNNSYIVSQNDAAIVQFLLNGRPGTPMNGFEGILTEEELQNLIVFLRTWQ